MAQCGDDYELVVALEYILPLAILSGLSFLFSDQQIIQERRPKYDCSQHHVHERIAGYWQQQP